MSTISTYLLLLSIGFLPDARIVSDPPGALSQVFGRHRIDAILCHNLNAQPIVLLSGVIATSSSVGELHCEMPRTMESVELGLSWVTWTLDEHRVFARASEVPPWVEEGRANRELLPWRRRMAEYEASPKCLVRRDYARLALKDLALGIAEEKADAILRLEFDGEVLRLRTPERVIAMPGRGEAWPESFEIPVDRIRTLPRRLSKDPVFFGIWEGALTLGNWR